MKKYLLSFLLILFVAIPCNAANKIYIAPETAVIFRDTGGDEVIDTTSLSQNEVAVSSIVDLGAGSHSPDFAVTFIAHGWATAPVAGDTINLYVAFGTSTTQLDGEYTTLPTDSTAGVALQSITDNVDRLTGIVGTSTATNATIQVSASFRSIFRYIVFIVENLASGADDLSATGVEIILTPVPLEIQ